MYTIENVKKVQGRLLEMAISCRDILEAHDIPYFIAYGTLLGAVRDHGFIPWDDDFDYYLFDDTYDKAISLLRKHLPDKYFVEDEQSEPLYFHGWAHIKDLHSRTRCDMYPHDGCYKHQGISVDLYRIKKMPLSQVESYRLVENIAYYDRRRQKGLISDNEYTEKTNPLKRILYDKNNRKFNVDDTEVYATVLPILDYLPVNAIIPLKPYEFEGHKFYGPNHAHEFLTMRYGDYLRLPSEAQRKPHYSDVTLLE